MRRSFTNLAFYLIAACVAFASDPIPDRFNTIRFYHEQQEQHGWQQFRRLEVAAQDCMTITAISGYNPILRDSYPRPSCLVKGINDTLVLRIQFLNKTDSAYKWEGTSPDAWIAPRLFGIHSNFRDDAPVIDSTDLAYGVRTYSYFGRHTAVPDSIPANDKATLLYMNVWNIPPGTWVLSAGLTEKAPKDFVFQVDGMEFTMLEARDKQDTLNALLGCGQRMFGNKTYKYAANWADSALALHPACGPAWWARALAYMFNGDSLETVQSFDSALKYFKVPNDPLLPDTLGQVEPVERYFMRDALPEIEYTREMYISEKGGIFRDWKK